MSDCLNTTGSICSIVGIGLTVLLFYFGYRINKKISICEILGQHCAFLEYFYFKFSKTYSELYEFGADKSFFNRESYPKKLAYFCKDRDYLRKEEPYNFYISQDVGCDEIENLFITDNNFPKYLDELQKRLYELKNTICCKILKRDPSNIIGKIEILRQSGFSFEKKLDSSGNYRDEVLEEFNNSFLNHYKYIKTKI